MNMNIDQCVYLNTISGGLDGMVHCRRRSVSSVEKGTELFTITLILQSIDERVDATVGEHSYDGKVIEASRVVNGRSESQCEKHDLVTRVTRDITNNYDH